MNGKTATDEKELVLIEKAIVRTMRKFRQSPKTFWSVDDIRCHLKRLLLKGRLFKSGPLGNVFLSFPTKNTYERREDGSLFSSASGKSDCFALAGWASSVPTTWSRVTQRLSFGIELEYFPLIPQDWVTPVTNSLLKLSDETNGIPPRGRFFLLLTGQSTSLFSGQLNALLAEFPSVRCYQQTAQ